MITRRAFLTALCALPLVGRWMPKPEYPMLDLRPIMREGRTVGYQRVSIYSVYDGVDPRDGEFLSGDQWPDSVRAERIKAGRPV